MNKLNISDGTTTINLFDPTMGFHLDTWSPSLPGLKSGGIYQSSPYSTGRDLVFAKIENLNESFTVHVNGGTQLEVIQRMRDLVRLLDKARNYWVTQWQQQPVWIEMQICEGSASLYAPIVNYQIDEIDELYREPFFTGMPPVVMQDIILGLEMRPWQATRPGTGECVSTVQEIEYDTGAWSLEDTPAGVTNIVRDFVQTSTGRVLAGMQDYIRYSDDNGATWALAWNLTPTSQIQQMLITDTGRILAVDSVLRNVWYSDDNGTNWAVLYTSAVGNGLYSIIQTQSGKLLLGGNAKIEYSTNDGNTWATATSAYGGRRLISLEDSTILAAFQYGGTSYYGIIRSTDDGVNWTEIISYYLGSSSKKFFQTSTGRVLFNTDDYFVYYSDDSGLTWKYYDATSLEMYQFRQDTDGNIYSASGNIYVSKDDGLTFTLYSSAVTNIVSFFIMANGNFLAGGNKEIWLYSKGIFTFGKELSCGAGVYIANKQNIANLTHIFTGNNAAPHAYNAGNLLPMSAFPVPLFAHVGGGALAVGDSSYYVISNAVINSGEFCSLVFDIDTPASSTTSYTIVWEYPTAVGAGPGFAITWTALTCTDNTQQFGVIGVNSVHWSQNQTVAWIEITAATGTTINGINGWVVRARISALAGTMTAPTQQNRNVYTTTNNWLEVPAASIAGELTALAQVKAANYSDKDGVSSATAPSLWCNRILAGLRSYDRGDLFASFINISDEQNPLGITITLGTNTAFTNDVTTVTGRLATYNPGGAEAMATRATITFGPTIAADYFGSYHAFLRVQRSADVSTAFSIRLIVVSGSGGIQYITETKQIPSIMNYELLDFGVIKMPVNDQLNATDYGDTSTILIQASATGGTPNLLIHDLVLIPTDESFVDSFDNALEQDSDVGASGSVRKLLDIDSITSPKVMVQSSVRTVGAELKTAVYESVSADEFIWQYNERQRMHFLAAQALLRGTHTGANNAAILTDSAVDFVACGVKVGMTIYNVTDGSSATITAVTATTVTGTLSGGAESDWDTGDAYYVVCSHWVAPHEISHSVQAYMTERYQLPKVIE